MDEGLLNERFAKHIIDLLVAQGVDYFCCAPGSRSTPLLIAVEAHPRAKRFVHFDERGLGFHAVGFGKATRRAAAVVVTSGTAVANLLPAIIEAHNERVPLLLLTADRPPELQDCGANQTCDQIKLFQNFVRAQIALPCPSTALPERYMATTIAHAVASAMHGPVHLNCPLREPLFAALPQEILASHSMQLISSVLYPSAYTIAEWTERLFKIKRGVILCGSDHLPYTEAVFRLAEALHWPIFADILSPLRQGGAHDHLITYFDPLLKAKSDLSCDAIVQFGNRFTSKTLQQWLERQSLEFYLHVSDHTMRQDPSHLITHHIHTTPQLFCQEIAARAPEVAQEEPAPLQDYNAACRSQLTQAFEMQNTLSEPAIFHELSSLFNEEWALFLANSMPIRDANQFLAPLHPCGPIFANRGVSGIDGNIATAVGIAQGTQKPTLALIGDLTLLHDVNSLFQVANSSVPIVILVINNGGGGIFSFLPIANRRQVFEEMIAAAHTLEFSHAAELFGLPYVHLQTLEELVLTLEEQQKAPHSCLIEVTTNREQNVILHQQLIACLKFPDSAPVTPNFLH
jgi:2-succinyl-5-enolpyruvyl-6-hydroxy-3-cyclohexene-1-carboxylate synthase